MKKLKIFWGLCIGVFIVCLLATDVDAGLVDSREINTMANSFIVNNELLYLHLLEGEDDSTVLRYGVEVTEAGWTNSLDGTFRGKALSVSYSGTYTPTSETSATITYTSTGTYGTDTWSGSGTLEWEEYDTPGPGLLSNGSVGGGLSGEGIGIQIGGAIRIGIVSLGASVQKDFVSKNLTTSAYIGLIDIPYLGSAWNTGGKFKLNQKTGEDQGYIYTEVLWGLYTKEKAVGDKTKWFRRKPPPPKRPPADPPRYTHEPVWPREDPPWDYPETPEGSTPGTEGLAPDETGYDYGYVGGYDSVPEPATLVLLSLGGLVLLRRRRG